MGTKILLQYLINYFGKQMNMSKEYTGILRKSLPTSMSEAHGKELAERLIKRCKFAPSIAEILDEWSLFRREMNRHVDDQPAHTTATNPRILQHLKQAREALQRGESIPQSVISDEMRQFVRTYYPEIPDSLIQKNWMEIANCMRDQKEQLLQNSRYQTVMHLTKEGVIELMMRKIA